MLVLHPSVSIPMYVDSHAHLDGKQFDLDRDEVIARARDAGVRILVAIGNGDGPPTLDAGVRLAEKYPFMYATVGIHPHEARLADETAFAEMERLAQHPKVIAWGEIGLDYYYDHSPRETQKNVFVRQMELAASAKAVHVELHHHYPSEGPSQYYVEFIFAMIYSRLRLAAGRDWQPVPDEVVIQQPNPHGAPVVWWYVEKGEIKIRCYAPGSGV